MSTAPHRTQEDNTIAVGHTIYGKDRWVVSMYTTLRYLRLSASQTNYLCAKPRHLPTFPTTYAPLPCPTPCNLDQRLFWEIRAAVASTCDAQSDAPRTLQNLSSLQVRFPRWSLTSINLEDSRGWCKGSTITSRSMFSPDCPVWTVLRASHPLIQLANSQNELF